MDSAAATEPRCEVFDVIVVGSGNAGFSAASSAAETLAESWPDGFDNGRPRVLLLEKAPESWAGGNTTFTAGAYRTAFHGLEDVLPLVHNVSSEMEHKIDMQPYSRDDFMGDLMDVTDNRSDPALARVLVDESRETTRWLARSVGVRFVLSFNRQAYEIDGRQKFWGGMVLAVEGGGKGLTQQHQANARRRNIQVRYDSKVVHLLTDPDSKPATGVRVCPTSNESYEVRARGGVVLAAGGFEASQVLRREFLGPEWKLAHVRGTPHNTGELLTTAMSSDAIQAQSFGDWSGCHSTCWDANAPQDAGDQTLTNQYTKSGYPLGLMINMDGKRFVDEGLDLRNFTYAKFGREILKQPDGVAFQVWDADGAAWLRKEEYAADVVERISADSIEQLADFLVEKGLVNKANFTSTVDEYNAAVAAFQSENPNAKFDPSCKDGLSTRSSHLSLVIDKTNWALSIVKPPFLAVKVACGVTFTFGGLKVDPETAGVIRSGTGEGIPGLYAAGETVGGLFWGNYPGGSGLTAGAVFGRKAGRSAATRALRTG